MVQQNINVIKEATYSEQESILQ